MNTSQDDQRAANDAFDGYLSAVRARRNSFVCISCAALAVLLTFAWASYSSIRANFTREKLVTNGQRVGQSLMESAQPQLIAAAKELVPVYRNEAERALRETLPMLRSRATQELEIAQRNIGDKAHAALEEAAIRPVQAALEQAMAEFPELRDEEYVAELLAGTESMLQSELARTLEETQAIYRPQLERLTTAMAELRSHELAEMDNDQLMQRFMHLWILLIDTELMGHAPCSVEALSMAGNTNEQGG